MKLVKKRKQHVNYKNAEEKMSHELASYQAAMERVGEIEMVMWERIGNNVTSCFAWLRTWMCWLYSFCSILQCESLFSAELSDFETRSGTPQNGCSKQHFA